MSDGVAKEWEFITPTSVCTPYYTIAFPHPFFHQQAFNHITHSLLANLTLLVLDFCYLKVHLLCKIHTY